MATNHIFFDNASTTSTDKEVLKKMEPFFKDEFGNAASLHSFGQRASAAVDESREKIAKFLNCNFEEVVFTSGATEADNLAVLGIIFANGYPHKKLHIITTAIEHLAVLETCQYLEKKDVEVSYVKPHKNGVVKFEDIEKEIKDNTVLISVMYVNNEIGTIQPIEKIGRLVLEKNKDREKRIYFHTDAVQAALWCEMDVKKLGVDLLSLSGHKIYGPKGIGALFVKQGTIIKPIQHGGHQEFGLRPGTLNTPLIVGMATAIGLIKKWDLLKVEKLRNYMLQKVQSKFDGVSLNGSLGKRVKNNLNLSIKGVEGEALLLGLDMEGIAVSTGSACSSGSLEPSHVLVSIGLSHEAAHGSLRITLGKDNNKEEVMHFLKILELLVKKYRKMAPKI